MKSITDRILANRKTLGFLQAELEVRIDAFNEKNQEWIDNELKAIDEGWGICTFQGEIHTQVNLEDVVCVDPHIELDGVIQEVVHVAKKHSLAGEPLYSVYTKDGNRVFVPETPMGIVDAETEEDEDEL